MTFDEKVIAQPRGRNLPKGCPEKFGTGIGSVPIRIENWPRYPPGYSKKRFSCSEGYGVYLLLPSRYTPTLSLVPTNPESFTAKRQHTLSLLPLKDLDVPRSLPTGDKTQSWLAQRIFWEGYHKSRRCSRYTYSKSYITKHTSMRRKTQPSARSSQGPNNSYTLHPTGVPRS